MKYFLPSFVTVILSLGILSTSITFAQTPTPSLRSQIKTQLQTLNQDARDQFKTKLAQIKDAHKQTIVSRVDTRIQTINTKRTKEMLDSLDRLSTILDRAVAKGASLTPVPSQEAVTTTARDKITASQTAVTAQQAKQYVIALTTDDALRQNVTATLLTFKTDITATHQSVLDAKEAVITAIKSLEPAETTPTNTPTGTTNL